MTITSIKIKVFNDSISKMKGIASVVFDDLFVINSIKVLFSNDHFFLAMPSKETKAGTYKDIVHPINETGRKILEEAVITVYQLAISRDADLLEVTYKGTISDPPFGFDSEDYEIHYLKSSHDDDTFTHHTSNAIDHLAVKPNSDIAPDDALTKWLES